ncbi:MAG: hypothetical protein KJ661_07485 [Candidatus Omnitrophica bacterium]|nr:hypothetical protein [Candidatus Omnitrophota bacterium]
MVTGSPILSSLALLLYYSAKKNRSESSKMVISGQLKKRIRIEDGYNDIKSILFVKLCTRLIIMRIW